MTPDEFHHSILPTILTAWERGCFCHSPGFLKLVSFNFEDYGIGPMAVVDSEILIAEIIGRRFVREGQLTYGVSAHTGILLSAMWCTLPSDLRGLQHQHVPILRPV